MDKFLMPQFDSKKHVNESPHIVILGAGASRASFLKGDKNGRELPLMIDFIETVGLKEDFEFERIDYRGRNFEELYDELTQSGKYTPFLTNIKKKIYEYFSQMEIPDELTIYDKLIMSLRNKDIIASFNWDPLLMQAYKRNGPLNLLPQLRFLHGNVAVGICEKDKIMGNIENCCSKCGEKFGPMKLLYPIKNKNYNQDPAISEEWEVLKHFLTYGYFITIFGYSAPQNDVDAVSIMKEIWDKNKTKVLNEVEIIDIKPEEDVRKIWKDFIFSHHYQIYNNFEQSYINNNPRRTCDAFASQTLNAEFLENKPIPKNLSVKSFHEWLKPLIIEEKEYAIIKKGFSILPCHKIRTGNQLKGR